MTEEKATKFWKLEKWVQLYSLVVLVFLAFFIGYVIGAENNAPEATPAVAVVTIPIQTDDRDEDEPTPSDLPYSAPQEAVDDNG